MSNYTPPNPESSALPPNPSHSPSPAAAQPKRISLYMEDLDPHLVTLVNPETLEAEYYRALGQKMVQLKQHSGLHVMAVSSPTTGDGKSTTALNLAGIMSQLTDMNILLIDMDLRRPTIDRYLGLLHDEDQLGLVDVILEPDVSLTDAIRICDPFNLAVLTAGRTTTSSYDLLTSPRLGDILAAARQAYNFIIIDTPPLIPLSDCQFIEKWVDGFLLIISAHKTTQEFLDESLNTVDHAKIIGLVFNQDQRIVRGDYAYYYSRYTTANRRSNKSSRPQRRRAAR